MVKALALALLFHAAPAAPAPEPACGSPEAAQQVRESMDRGRRFFMSSLAEAYERLQHGDPIQVDIYVLVHFLLYQDELQLEPDLAAAAAWRRRCVQYFLSTFGKNIWEREGCVTVKLLVGLRTAKVAPERIEPVARYYSDFIHHQWGDTGVGECLSPKVVRTYGSTSTVPRCGPVVAELVAKTATYEAMLGAESADPMASVKLPTLNEAPGALTTWFEVVPEEWILRAYLQRGQKLVTRKRYLASRKALAAAVATAPLDTAPVQTMYLAPLVYESWLAGNPVDAKSYAVLRKVMSAQQADGRILSSMNELRAKGHNIDASPTYMALLAMDQYLKKQKECAAK